MNKQKIFTILIIFSIIAGLSFIIKPIALKAGIGKYKTESAKKHTIEQVVEASGTINPVNTVSVGSTVSGLMMEV